MHGIANISKKKYIFIEHVFCGNREILGHLCRLFYFRTSVSKNAFVHMWHDIITFQ